MLGTISFTVCFAAWLIGAFAPHFRSAFHLTAAETALLVAVPVLLRALARIPIGILTDRFGGRTIFSILLACTAVPVWLVPEQASYSRLLAVAFVLGLAGSSFAIGVATSPGGLPPSGRAARWGSMGWAISDNPLLFFSARYWRRRLEYRTFFTWSRSCLCAGPGCLPC